MAFAVTALRFQLRHEWFIMHWTSWIQIIKSELYRNIYCKICWNLLDVNVLLQVAYIKNLRLTWVLKQTQYVFFCYRAQLYNFVIKCQHRCLSNPVWGGSQKSAGSDPGPCIPGRALQRPHCFWRCLAMWTWSRSLLSLIMACPRSHREVCGKGHATTCKSGSWWEDQVGRSTKRVETFPLV